MELPALRRVVFCCSSDCAIDVWQSSHVKGKAARSRKQV